jgi:hypothetical protein
MAFPQGFKPCHNCRLTREYPDLCDMCEEIVARWEPEEDVEEPPCTCNAPGGYCDCPGAPRAPSIWER